MDARASRLTKPAPGCVNGGGNANAAPVLVRLPAALWLILVGQLLAVIVLACVSIDAMHRATRTADEIDRRLQHGAEDVRQEIKTRGALIENELARIREKIPQI